MKILVLGSTLVTEKVVEKLKTTEFELVGYIPSSDPFIKGDIDLPIVQSEQACRHDIKLSIQYDKKIIEYHNAYNIHTGLLPYWGGRDLMFHTLKEKEVEQGLTFHKMTDQFDYGPIISKITYPVLPDDSEIELYGKQLIIAPDFVYSSLKLLEKIGAFAVDKCYMKKPRLFRKRKNISDKDLADYIGTGKKLIETYGAKKTGV